MGKEDNQEKLKQFTLCEVVELLEKITDKAQIILKNLLLENLHRNNLFITICKEDADLFSNCPLVTVIETPLQNRLSKMNKGDIIAALEKIGVEAPKKILKAELPQWCQENAPEIGNVITLTYDISFVGSFKKSQRKTYTYLKRKFDWDCYYNGNMEKKYFPYGSNQNDFVFSTNYDGESVKSETKFDEKYYFPDDDVTELLTKYHHNRCLNGFVEIDNPDEND